MKSVLFLCHRLPWPPDKGDKIRSYRIFRRLAERHRVYLGTFVDDPADWQHLDAVTALCANVCVRPLKPWTRRVRALSALARGEALTAGIYRDRVLRRWVEGVLASAQPDLAVCFSSGVAPLVMRHDDLRRVMDFVDVDSDKWRQYADDRGGPAGLLYRREARRLASLEHAVARRFDASVFVSEPEAAFFRRHVPEAAARIHGIPNGVDAGYWDPERPYANPYPAGTRAIVFVGAMDYHANADAVRWFADAVWPRIAAGQPQARFWIVGSHPTPAVRALGERPGITVTGRVDDVRPYVAHAHAVAAPLRIARGIQNKVLEALAMEKVVLATPEAWEGIEDFAGREGCIDSAPEVIAAAALQWLDRPQPARVPAARTNVLERHDWARNLDRYEDVLRSVRRAAALDTAVRAAGLEVCS